MHSRRCPNPPGDVIHDLRHAHWDLGLGGIPLVLLHEGLGCLALWRDFPEALGQSTGRQVWALERRGHGGSAPLGEEDFHPGWLDVEGLDRLPRHLDQLGVGPCVLIGHSDGGTMALLCAVAHPDRIRGVITLAAHVTVDEHTVQGVRSAGETFRTGTLAERLRRYHGTRTESLFWRWHDTWLSPAHRSWSLLDRLPQIRCPVLAIQGEDDPYGLPAQAEAIALATGGRSVLLPACRHAPHLEAREATLAAITIHLAACTAPD